MTTAIFTVGQTYTTRAIGDRGCKFDITIAKRTAKTVTAEVMGEIKSFRVAVYEGVELIKPFGSYSMAPILRAA